MSVLPSSYYKTLEKVGGAGISAHIGGAGPDASEDLKKPLSELFKEWRAEWKRLGLIPKRKSKEL